MKSPGSKTKQMLLLCIVLVTLIGLWWILYQRSPEQTSHSTTVVSDEEAGLTVSIPSAYRSYASSQSNPDPSSKGLIGNYLRTEPAAYLTLRYDTGLRSITNLLRRGTLEHIEAEIANFFPVKYSNYESIETKHIDVAGRESIEHRFRSTLPNGEPLQTMLLAIPYSDDVAYYCILQSSPDVFERVQADLDVVKDSLQLSGPQPPTQSS